MDPVDSSYGEVRLADAWSALAHRAAVIIGALSALMSLLWDVPVWAASLRGACAWLAIIVLMRGTRWLLAKTASDHRASQPQKGDTQRAETS